MVTESQSQRALRTGLDAAEDFGEMQVDQQPNSQVNMASPGNMMAALQEVQQNIMPEPRNNNTVTDFSKAQDELYRASAARSILARRKRNKQLKDQQQSRRGQENIIGNADDFNNGDEDDEPIE